MSLEVGAMLMSVAVRMGWVYIANHRREEWRNGRWQQRLDSFMPIRNINADVIPKLRGLMNLTLMDGRDVFAGTTLADANDHNASIKPSKRELFFWILKHGELDVNLVTFNIAAQPSERIDQQTAYAGPMNPDDEDFGRPD